MRKKLLILLFLFIPLGVFLFSNKESGFHVPITVPTPTPVSLDREVSSPDGTKTVKMDVDELESGEYLYTFSVAGKKIFGAAGSKGEYSITGNAFSPDNKYVYILRKNDSGVNAYVVKASSEPFSSIVKYLEVAPSFEKKETGYTISDITGWDSETLVKIQSKKGSEKGPNFWFEVPSTAVIQLYR